MSHYSSLLVVVASVCLVITLGLAWCLVGVRSTARMKRIFPNYQYLLKAHIDYLMMTGLLMIFFLLFDRFGVRPPRTIVLAMCTGSFLNPVGFIALAVKPTINQAPASPFGAVMTSSFTLTTIGYAGAAWLVGQAALGGLR